MMCLWQTGLTQPVTSYSNSGGTGNRKASVTATSNVTWPNGSTPPNLIDGSFTASNSTALNTSLGTASAGTYLRFDFGSGVKKYIDEAKLTCDRSISNGSWKFQGSNDASSWTDLATFTWNTQTQTVGLSGMDLAGYRYYQMVAAGGSITGALFEEIEFKIADGAT